jgi:hypothetical protein
VRKEEPTDKTDQKQEHCCRLIALSSTRGRWPKKLAVQKAKRRLTYLIYPEIFLEQPFSWLLLYSSPEKRAFEFNFVKPEASDAIG